MYGFTHGSYGSTYATSGTGMPTVGGTYSTATNAAAAQQQLAAAAAGSAAAGVFGASSAFPLYGGAATAAMYSGYGQQTPSAQVTSFSSSYPHSASRLSDGYGGGSAATAAAVAAASLNYGFSNLASPTRSVASATSALANNANALAALTTTNANRAAISSTYSGYDAAVYAAASSILQSKSASTSRPWSNGDNRPASSSGGGPARRGGRGGGTFPSKRYGGGGFGGGGAEKRDASAALFYCETCKISCAGMLTYKEHLEGQRHKKKEALLKGENNVSLPKSKVSFRCDLCNVTCTGSDTYNAHIRGAKHIKTLNLCKKLGKPIPADEPTIIPPSELGGMSAAMPPPAPLAPVSAVSSGSSAANAPTKKVIGIATTNFVSGGGLASTAVEIEKKKSAVVAAVGSAGLPLAHSTENQQHSEEVEALLAAEQAVKPVGESYIEAEKDSTGKVTSFHCKLCDCHFSDPNAKEIHLKGRRHRLQYKAKVDPSLEIEFKPSSRGRGPRGQILPPPPYMRRGFMMGPPRPFPCADFDRPWMPGPLPLDGRRSESSDDRHVNAKHVSIYADDSLLSDIERLVVVTEKGLKGVSDYFTERDSMAKAEGETATKDRVLKGVMRVGLLAKGLLLKGDNEVELVVLCSQPPTTELLSDVCRMLPKYAQVEAEPAEVVVATEKSEEAAILVSFEEKKIFCRLTFTSVVLRETNENGEAKEKAEKEKPLPADKCLEALARLRHAKWFQVRCEPLQSCQITLRIMRDVRRRVPFWAVISDWMMELLVEKVLASSPVPLSPGDALRRVFEAISAGIVNIESPGIGDPCEKGSPNVLLSMTAQQREDITSSAQHALRLIAFNQLYKVLDMERLYDSAAPPTDQSVDRKRPRDSNGTLNEEAKKDKREDDTVPSMEA